MNKKTRLIFGVITASASDIEQREILSGIISKAQEENIDIVVLSDVYNPIDTTPILQAENHIYDFILSPAFDGLILISESIINQDLKQTIIENLKKIRDIPVIILGTPQPDFEPLHFLTINTSDETDMEEITNHLIEKHGYRDIAILSGYKFLEASHKRVDGYRHALEQHGIAFQPEKVFFGDFWLNSGRDYAKKYISGEIPYSQALIFCNDYMAYGFLDEFMNQEVTLTDKMAIIGYEYIRERYAHTPLLATYQRNRKGLGISAVEILCGKNPETFVPPHGRIIPGETCGCGGNYQNIKREMQDLQKKETYEFLNLFSQLDQRLTECRTLREFVVRCWDFQFMIRNVHRLYLCLYENWNENAPNSENMIRYNLLGDEKPVIFHKHDFSAFTSSTAEPYYLCPLFFGDKDFGYAVLNYAEPDTFDPIFRNWLKSISNGLEFLRTKNDIRYLIACQNLSEQYDQLTSLYNETSIKNIYLSEKKENLYFLLLKTCLFDSEFSVIQTEEKLKAILDTTKAVQEFCGKTGFGARIAQDTFLCLKHSSADAPFLEDLLFATLCQHSAYFSRYGIDSFVCTAQPCESLPYASLKESALQTLQQKLSVISNRRRDKNYAEVLALRNKVYQDPSFDNFASQFHSSKGYLRQIYKRCFHVSYHQDCIYAKIAKAKYLLSATEMTIQEISYHCGYSDSKYFMRQFVNSTGLTAKNYALLAK